MKSDGHGIKQITQTRPRKIPGLADAFEETRSNVVARRHRDARPGEDGHHGVAVVTDPPGRQREQLLADRAVDSYGA